MGIRRLIFIILLMPILLSAAVKIPAAAAQEIVAFTLFNYDNLIADSYEVDFSYIGQLTYLLSKATGVNEQEYRKILLSQELRNEAFPPQYMLTLNKKTRALSGYYFVDTDD
ncbi:hypothetical protein HP1_014 [Candidatus Termititenax spirochaetophilus]|uniref:Uncharacterized protein n=1 Tax=Candidatus Termititenax spirochaetophilus TaxID=2218522 RepID=A0A388T6W7_9BACT|nr:hypothetical protein HP1_014 [Candidatus Termititenax spirochaetophilus]